MALPQNLWVNLCEHLLKFVLSRDTDGDRPTQIYYSTNLELTSAEVLSTYSRRWAIEVTHHDSKQFLGLEDPANRVPLAVQRTAPMAMFLYSLTCLWYSQHGHQHLQFPDRPWYPAKSEHVSRYPRRIAEPYVLKFVP